MKYANTVLDLVGNTPLVKLNSVTAGIKATVLAKLEFVNPGGSIKDRIAVSLVADAEADGQLKPGGTIVEPTSGNTGVGLAMVAAIRGYDAVFVTPDKVGQSKRDVLSAYGAEVVVTATNVAPESPDSYYGVSDRITRERPGAFKPNQFANQAGPAAHYATTGPEIWNDTDGRVTHCVIGAGTGGTITGTGRYLHDASADRASGPVKIIAADPHGSIYADHDAELHGYYVEGVGEDMIPDTYDPSVPDGFVTVDDAASFEMTRRLAVEEGLLVGGSSGMAVVAALEVARDLTEDDVVVVVLPDSGRGYIDKIFNEEWMAGHGFATSSSAAQNGKAVPEAPAGSQQAIGSQQTADAQQTAGLRAADRTVADLLADLGIEPGAVPSVAPDTPIAEALEAMRSDVVLVADPAPATEFNLYGTLSRDAVADQVLFGDETAASTSGTGATTGAADSAGTIGSLQFLMEAPTFIGIGQSAAELRAALADSRGVAVMDAGRPVAFVDRTDLARWAARKDS